MPSGRYYEEELDLEFDDEDDELQGVGVRVPPLRDDRRPSTVGDYRAENRRLSGDDDDYEDDDDEELEVEDLGKHKTIKQDEIFLNFFVKHPGLAKGFEKGDRVVQEELWSNLCDELNAYGPPVKDVGNWKKAWQDWRLNIKRKLSENKAEDSRTGGGPFNKHHITRTEEELAVICGLYTTVDGVEGAKTFSCSNIPNKAGASKQDIASRSKNHKNSPIQKDIGVSNMNITPYENNNTATNNQNMISSDCSSAGPSHKLNVTTQNRDVAYISDILVCGSDMENDGVTNLDVERSGILTLSAPPSAKKRKTLNDVTGIMEEEAKNFELLGEKLTN